MGKGKEVETLTLAAKQATQDTRIIRILVASGDYNESVRFEKLKQSITIEGESNDPKSGTRLFAPPPPTGANNDYAALQLIQIDQVVVKRLYISGKAHGLFVQNTQSVTVDNNHLTANTGSGAIFRSNKKVILKENRITNNGGTRSNSPLYTQLRFGLVIQGSTEVSIAQNEIARNGAGGASLSTNTIAVTVDNNHRIVGHNSVSVTVDNNHRVTLKNNSIHHNGPVGRAGPLPKASCKTSCKKGSFCEGGFCHSNLQSSAPSGPSDAVALLGVGIVVAGAASVQLSGNSFFANDSNAMLLYSVGTVGLTENAIERNGVRLHTSARTMRLFEYPAIHIWDVTTSVTATHNLLTDNATSGLMLSHLKHAGQNLSNISVTVDNNHMSGNGRFLLAGNNPVGDGLCIVTEETNTAVKYNVKQNHFQTNGRTGFFTNGASTGVLSNNSFENHPSLAVALINTGQNPSNTIVLEGNAIKRAATFGVKIVGGQAAIQIQNNIIQDLQSKTNGGEADAINLTQLSGNPVVIKNNTIKNNTRAGIFLDAAKAIVNDNSLTGNLYPLLTQNNASATGNNANLAQNPQTPLTNRKVLP